MDYANLQITIYKLFFAGLWPQRPLTSIWKCKCVMKIKVFAWLFRNDWLNSGRSQALCTNRCSVVMCNLPYCREKECTFSLTVHVARHAGGKLEFHGTINGHMARGLTARPKVRQFRPPKHGTARQPGHASAAPLARWADTARHDQRKIVQGSIIDLIQPFEVQCKDKRYTK